MNILLALCFLTFAVFNVSGQSSLGTCTRPNGEQGLCIRYDQCPEILEQLQRRTRNNRELMKYSCGFDGKIPKVCCNFDCYTPDGNLGKCQNVNSCPHLNEMTKTTDKDKRAYVRDSRCTTGPRDVCCGPPPADTYAQPREDCTAQTAFPPHPNTMCCGFDAQSSSKIYGGINTGIDEYPWLALLEYKKKDTGEIKSYCGGTLISSRYVVTAAHCISGPGAWPPINVRLGEFDTSTDEDCVDGDCADPVQTIPIEDIITHPEYNPKTSRHDIALIRLANPVPYTDFIRPICLPASNVLKNTDDKLEAYVAGWGKVNQTHSRSHIKQQVKVPIVKTQDCQNSFSTRKFKPPVTVTGNQICAGGEAGKDSCNGDSGGPLMLKTGLLHELIGVVSFGLKNCGTQGLPGVYTNVYSYYPWIWRNIRP